MDIWNPISIEAVRSIMAFGSNQTLRQLQSIHRPENLWPGTMHMRLSGCRTAVQQRSDPLLGNGLSPVYCTKEGATDGRVGVGIPASHDGIYHSLL